MRNAHRSTAIALDHRVWRDMTRLAARSLAVGIVASLVLAFAVFAFA